MRITFDREVDAAYIYLADIPPGGVADSYNCPPRRVGGILNLDFDSDHRLVGIEVLGASKRLPSELLVDAEAPTARPKAE